MKHRFPLFFSLAFLSLFLFLFGGPPGFRDGAHFYGPLFEYLRSELVAGRLPLWNPYENLGQPLAANPTTMLFYPGLWIALSLTLLPGIDATVAYTFFAAVHLVLAFLLTYRLARSWGCTQEAACFAGLCYTLGGSVLFQWNNVPFLVGAAWFPEALRLAEKLLHEKTAVIDCRLFGLVLALMVLGGEPQAAFHAALCAPVMMVFYRCTRRTACQYAALYFRFAACFCCSLFITFFLTAVQILPAIELGMLSDRATAAHRNWVYHFSVPPWRILEFFWPNASGWQFPIHARWFSALPGDQSVFDSEIWVPSMYMGGIAAVLALLVFFCRSKQAHWKAVKFLLLLFVLGSFGNWFCVYAVLDGLPGYGMFRYPAKLMTPASLMIALLAAQGFDRLQWDERFRNGTLFALHLNLLALWGVLAVINFDSTPFKSVPACPLFGPFSPDQALSCLVFSSICMFAFVMLISLVLSLRAHICGLCGLLLLMLTAIDLTAANAWMMTTLPRNMPPKNKALSPLLAKMEQNGATPVRIYRFPHWYPKEFETTSSANRLAEAAAWDRHSLYHRYPLPLRINMADVPGTLLETGYYQVLAKMRRHIADGETEMLVRELARLGVQYVVAPGDAELEAELLHKETNLSFWKLSDTAARRYIEYKPDRIVFETNLSKPGTVVICEQYWPGWRAFLDDGTEIPVICTEGVFRSVNVPGGKRQVTMVYDPPLLKIGALLGLSGIFLLGVTRRITLPAALRTRRTIRGREYL